MQDQPRAGSSTGSGDPGVPAGAMCGVHVERPASIVCARCGDFACRACVGTADAGRCAACDALPGAHRMGFGNDWRVSQLFTHGARVLGAAPLEVIAVLWAVLTPYYVVIALPGLLIELLAGLDNTSMAGRATSLGADLLAQCMAGPLVLGMYAYTAARVRGADAGLSMLWSQTHKWRRYMPVAVTIWAFSAPLVLMTPPDDAELETLTGFVLATVAYATTVIVLVQLAAIELAVNDRVGGADALRIAMRNVRGRLLAVIGVSWLMTALLLASIMLCLLPSVLIFPYTTLVYVTMYLAMRPDAAGAGRTP